jgi:hypothetical protein
VIKLSDPLPAYCSACHNMPADSRFVDFDAAHDAGSFVDRNLAYVAGSDDLHICEACLRAGMEVLALKPEVSSNQLREIRRLQAAVEHWREYAQTLEATLQDRPEPAPRQRRKAGTAGTAGAVA